MDTNLFDELIEEIRNMTPEEYNAFHKEALIMRKAADKIFGKREAKQKTHWHDLRENKDDLPKFWEKVYVKLSIGRYTFAMYGKDNSGNCHWWYRAAFDVANEHCEMIPYDIIAWCIPQKLPIFDGD